MPDSEQDKDRRSKKDTERRRDEGLKNLLRTPPKPFTPKKDEKKKDD